MWAFFVGRLSEDDRLRFSCRSFDDNDFLESVLPDSLKNLQLNALLENYIRLIFVFSIFIFYCPHIQKLTTCNCICHICCYFLYRTTFFQSQFSSSGSLIAFHLHQPQCCYNVAAIPPTPWFHIFHTIAQYFHSVTAATVSTGTPELEHWKFPHIFTSLQPEGQEIQVIHLLNQPFGFYIKPAWRQAYVVAFLYSR